MPETEYFLISLWALPKVMLRGSQCCLYKLLKSLWGGAAFPCMLLDLRKNENPLFSRGWAEVILFLGKHYGLSGPFSWVLLTMVMALAGHSSLLPHCSPVFSLVSLIFQ